MEIETILFGDDSIDRIGNVMHVLLSNWGVFFPLLLLFGALEVKSHTNVLVAKEVWTDEQIIKKEKDIAKVWEGYMRILDDSIQQLLDWRILFTEEFPNELIFRCIFRNFMWKKQNSIGKLKE